MKNRSTKIEQAVILAGGRGTRLRPLTHFFPKPMVSFHGRPFLEYLICQLREQGVTRILLLLGYMAELIKDCFGDGSSLGVRIEYDISRVDDRTGTRLRLAAPKIDDRFLLMYCDNYWPLRIDEMVQSYDDSDAAVQITIYRNLDRYTKSNVRVAQDGKVLFYDKTRSRTDLNGVDIGYAIVDKKVLNLLSRQNENFEKTVYPLLASRSLLGAFRTDHRYYSIGTIDRLRLTDAFLRNSPAIILDRDGVINQKVAKSDYVKTWSEFKWMPGAIEAIRKLKLAGYTVIIVTNQAGLARGMMSEKDLADVHCRMKKILEKCNAMIDAIYFCPHGWDAGCGCRKPKPGMLFKAQKDFNLNLNNTIFVGDDVRDMMAGKAAGCRTVLVNNEKTLLKWVDEELRI